MMHPIEEKIIDLIPEDDKTCVNCVYFLDGCEDKECCNFLDKYEENKFIPDTDYIEDEFASCENCMHYEGLNCKDCKRLYRDDMWEWEGTNE